MKELQQQLTESIIVIRLTVLIIEKYHCYQPHTEFYLKIISQDMETKLLGITSVEFHVTETLPIKYSAFVMYPRKNGEQCYKTSRKHVALLGLTDNVYHSLCFIITIMKVR
jgi:hypothetical protein